jgi:hypothetical protein
VAAVSGDLAECLKCVECGRHQLAGERGWKAYLTTDEDEPAGLLPGLCFSRVRRSRVARLLALRRRCDGRLYSE